MKNNPCKLHDNEECLLCDKYELELDIWNGRKEKMLFWVGQNAGFAWGPMGMEDEIYVTFIPAKPL